MLAVVLLHDVDVVGTDLVAQTTATAVDHHADLRVQRSSRFIPGPRIQCPSSWRPGHRRSHLRPGPRCSGCRLRGCPTEGHHAGRHGRTPRASGSREGTYLGAVGLEHAAVLLAVLLVFGEAVALTDTPVHTHVLEDRRREECIRGPPRGSLG